MTVKSFDPAPRPPAGVALAALRIGPVAPLAAGVDSGIVKAPVEGPLFLGRTGLAGDQQADRRVHGGAEKAVHHYPLEHYDAWRSDPAAPDPAPEPGSFGENLSTRGLTEAEVCVGDIYRLGGSLLAVSQARQPCWKIDLRFGRRGFARRVQDSGRIGWYYRVLEEGTVAPGDRFALLDRPHADWPLARLLHVWFHDPLDRAALEAIAGLASLTERWRQAARRRLDSGQVEDWSHRLGTPA